MRASFSSETAHRVGKGSGGVGVRSTVIPFQRSRIGIACVRVTFGSVWAWNALLLTQYLTRQGAGAYVGQMITSSQHVGQHISSWGSFWQNIVAGHPVGFVLLCSVGMGFVASGLLFGLLTNLACGVGSVCALFFWSTQLVSLLPGGIPAGDTGVLLVFLLAFLGFILSGAGQMYGADRLLAHKMGRWAFLAAGKVRKVRNPVPEYQERRRIEFPTNISRENGLNRTRTMNGTGVSSTREKEVAGVHKGRFNTKE